MQFNFSESELSYIIKHFNYPSLIGVEKQLYDEQRVISSLCDKKYLMFVNGDYELSYAVRILLNAWRSIRYSIVRTDLNDDKYLTCIFASEEVILFLLNHLSEIQIDMLDFSEEKMDYTIIKYLGLSECKTTMLEYNISLSIDDFLTLFFSHSVSENERLSPMLGLPIQEVKAISDVLNKKPDVSIIVQDLKRNIGSLDMIFTSDCGWYMAKHITPPNHDERVVLVKGNIKQIADSIYIL